MGVGDGKGKMNSSLNLISKNSVRLILILGSALLLTGILLVALDPPGESVNAQGQGNCDSGWVFKANSPNDQGVFVYNGQDTIIKVFIKSGQKFLLKPMKKESSSHSNYTQRELIFVKMHWSCC